MTVVLPIDERGVEFARTYGGFTTPVRRWRGRAEYVDVLSQVVNSLHWRSRIRISTLRRLLFTLPGFITVHSHKATIKLIGGGVANLQWFEEYWHIVAHC